jgi:uncharacterized membrane protein
VRTSSVRSLVYLAGGLGLLVSLFAAAEFYTASLRSVCSLSQFFSCATVDTSGKTSTLGIPDYAWGIGGFVALLVVAGLAERSPHDVRPAYLLAALATAAVTLSGYFIYVQLAEIHALCVVCASAEAFGVLVWAGAVTLALRAGRRARGREETRPDGGSGDRDPSP